MITFYLAYLKMWLKWHLRLSRSKPGKWKYGKIWSTSSTYYTDRKIFLKESRVPYYKRVDGPCKLECHYLYPSEPQGDYTFIIPSEGYEVGSKKKKKTMKRKKKVIRKK